MTTSNASSVNSRETILEQYETMTMCQKVRKRLCTKCQVSTKLREFVQKRFNDNDKITSYASAMTEACDKSVQFINNYQTDKQYECHFKYSVFPTNYITDIHALNGV